MARKDRTLAGFGDVAKVNNDNNADNKNDNNKVNSKDNDFDANIDIDLNDDNNVNVNKNKNSDNNGEEDFIDQLLSGKKKKETEQVVTGFYLRKDISQILDKLAKKGGRGTKSQIANDALEKLFKEKGLM